MDLSLYHASAEAPEQPALVAGPVTLSYRELWERAALLGPCLEQAARAPVGVVAANELETAVLWHALVAQAIPALLLHPRLSRAERAAIVSRAGAVAGSEIDWDAANRSPFALRHIPDDERPLAIVPTSGSTGLPRLAVLSRRALLASARASAQNLGWQPGDRWLVSLPLAHVGGMAILARCLVGRQTAVLGSPGDTASMVEALSGNDITLLSLVPAQLERLLDLWPRPEPPPGLRALVLGGDAASPELLERARAWPVLTTYGLTETCSHVTCQQYGTRPHPDHGSGPPLPGVELGILEGRIQVRGAQLFSGYWGESGAALDPAAWFESGDLGRLDAHGRLHVLGRASDLIITGGENVHPAEVEAVLGRVPGVRTACVFGVKDRTFGEVVAAALVTRGPVPPDDQTLYAHLDAELAPFKHPRQIAFITAIEYGPGGKLDRARTAEQAHAGLRAFGRAARG
jgi:O-succinylbenzoic acid--CoA ligase